MPIAKTVVYICFSLKLPLRWQLKQFRTKISAYWNRSFYQNISLSFAAFLLYDKHILHKFSPCATLNITFERYHVILDC